MNKKTILLIIITVSIALIGSILLQMYWIRLTLKEQERQFDREVNQALASIVDEIDKREQTFLDRYAEYPREESEKILRDHTKKSIIERLGNRKGLLQLDSSLKKAVHKLGERKEHSERREYHYGIYSERDSGIVVIDNSFTVSHISGNMSSSGVKSGLYTTPYTANLFQVEERINERLIVRKEGSLFLYLPYRKQIIWASLLPAAIGSLLFTILILACFAYTIYVIQRQKKVSDMKNDFINNMTHEFKTPIATVLCGCPSAR